MIDGIEDILCFSSDWPHPSMDDHVYVARQLPDAWHAEGLLRQRLRGLRLDAAGRRRAGARRIRRVTVDVGPADEFVEGKPRVVDVDGRQVFVVSWGAS